MESQLPTGEGLDPYNHAAEEDFDGLFPISAKVQETSGINSSESAESFKAFIKEKFEKIQSFFAAESSLAGKVFVALPGDQSEALTHQQNLSQKFRTETFAEIAQKKDVYQMKAVLFKKLLEFERAGGKTIVDLRNAASSITDKETSDFGSMDKAKEVAAARFFEAEDQMERSLQYHEESTLSQFIQNFHEKYDHAYRGFSAVKWEDENLQEIKVAVNPEASAEDKKEMSMEDFREFTVRVKKDIVRELIDQMYPRDESAPIIDRIYQNAFGTKNVKSDIDLVTELVGAGVDEELATNISIMTDLVYLELCGEYASWDVQNYTAHLEGLYQTEKHLDSEDSKRDFYLMQKGVVYRREYRAFMETGRQDEWKEHKELQEAIFFDEETKQVQKMLQAAEREETEMAKGILAKVQHFIEEGLSPQEDSSEVGLFEERLNNQDTKEAVKTILKDGDLNGFQKLKMLEKQHLEIFLAAKKSYAFPEQMTMSKELACKSREIKDLEKELEQAKATMEAAPKIHLELSKQLQDVQLQKETLSSQLEEINEGIEFLEGEHQRLKLSKEEEGGPEALDTLVENISDKKKTQEALQKRVDDLGRELADIESNIKITVSEMDEAETKHGELLQEKDKLLIARSKRAAQSTLLLPEVYATCAYNPICERDGGQKMLAKEQGFRGRLSDASFRSSLGRLSPLGRLSSSPSEGFTRISSFYDEPAGLNRNQSEPLSDSTDSLLETLFRRASSPLIEPSSSSSSSSVVGRRGSRRFSMSSRRLSVGSDRRGSDPALMKASVAEARDLSSLTEHRMADSESATFIEENPPEDTKTYIKKGKYFYRRTDHLEKGIQRESNSLKEHLDLVHHINLINESAERIKRGSSLGAYSAAKMIVGELKTLPADASVEELEEENPVTRLNDIADKLNSALVHNAIMEIGAARKRRDDAIKSIKEGNGEEEQIKDDCQQIEKEYQQTLERAEELILSNCKLSKDFLEIRDIVRARLNSPNLDAEKKSELLERASKDFGDIDLGEVESLYHHSLKTCIASKLTSAKLSFETLAKEDAAKARDLQKAAAKFETLMNYFVLDERCDLSPNGSSFGNNIQFMEQMQKRCSLLKDLFDNLKRKFGEIDFIHWDGSGPMDSLSSGSSVTEI